MALKEILSPLPGTFYLKPSPDAPPYVKAGDMVNVGDVIGLVEVMKMFSQVTAEVSGRVVAYATENESAVDAGQILLTLE